MSSDASIAMVTDDLRWIGPRSMDFLFEDGHSLDGGNSLRGLPFLDHALYTGYKPGQANVHFLIAEGDIVVMEFDPKFTGWEGEAYHNFYCLIFVLRDGKIAEIREHADTKYVWNTLLDSAKRLSCICGDRNPTKELAMSTSLPTIISDYLAASDGGNIDAIVMCFTEDAVVFDEDHQWRGHAQIRQWREGVTAAFEYTVEVRGADALGQVDGVERHHVYTHLEGNFPGGTVDLTQEFGLRDDRIATLQIVPTEAAGS